MAPTVFADGVSLGDSRFHHGVGAGLFMHAAFLSGSVDLAYGLDDDDVRVHAAASIRF